MYLEAAIGLPWVRGATDNHKGRRQDRKAPTPARAAAACARSRLRVVRRFRSTADPRGCIAGSGASVRTRAPRRGSAHPDRAGNPCDRLQRAIGNASSPRAQIAECPRRPRARLRHERPSLPSVLIEGLDQLHPTACRCRRDLDMRRLGRELDHRKDPAKVTPAHVPGEIFLRRPSLGDQQRMLVLQVAKDPEALAAGHQTSGLEQGAQSRYGLNPMLLRDRQPDGHRYQNAALHAGEFNRGPARRFRARRTRGHRSTSPPVPRALKAEIRPRGRSPTAAEREIPRYLGEVAPADRRERRLRSPTPKDLESRGQMS
jgi:hypothetical protein